MISIQQIQLNIVRAYMEHLEHQFSVPTIESSRLLGILKIYEWQKKRFLRRMPLSLDNLATLKHGVRESECLLQSIPDESSLAVEAREIVCGIILELTKEIVHTEEAFPDLKWLFDRERAHYRKMKEEAEEALKYD